MADYISQIKLPDNNVYNIRDHITDHFVMHGYTRNNITTTINYDNPQYNNTWINGLYEIRNASEMTSESGTRPATGYYPMLSLRSEHVMMQLGGINSQGWFIRGTQAGSPTLEGIAWQKLITDANYKSYAWARPSSIIGDQVLISSGTDGSTTLRAILNNTTASALGWNNAGNTNANNLRLIDVNTLAYWNGAYSGTSSNLAYYKGGAFGTMAKEAAADYAKLASPTFTGTPKAPTAVNGTSTTQIATTEFVNNTLAYANAMTFKGTLGTGGTVTALPATHNAGDTYRVITAGTWADKYCEVGTLIICTTDGTTANDAHWTSVETNEDGAVIGTTPTSSTDNAIVRWDGSSGRIIQDSGITIDDNNNLTTTGYINQILLRNVHINNSTSYTTNAITEIFGSTDTASGAKFSILRMQANAPESLRNNYATGIAWKNSDTHGAISVAYATPNIKIAGGNGTGMVWWIGLKGTSGQTYTFPSTSKTLAATDGTNASGKWSINTSGKADTAGTADKATAANLATTTNSLAYYTNETGTFGNTGSYITYLNHIAANAGTNKAGNIDGLLIKGFAYGEADNLISGVAGQMSYGDAGPQIRFNSGEQLGAMIFNHYDSSSGMGAAFHFVTNQGTGVAVKANGLIARDRAMIGGNSVDANYNLYVNGTSYLNGATTINYTTAASSIVKSGQLIVQSGTGSNAVAIELYRNSSASWQIVNTSGMLQFNDNYTTSAQNTYTNNCFSMTYNTGNATFKGTVTASGFIGNASSATGVKDAGNANRIITIRYGGDGAAATDWIPMHDSSGNLVPVSSTNLANKIRDKASGSWGISITGNAASATVVGKGTHTAAVTANEFSSILSAGTMTIVGNVSNTSMPKTNNANAELIIKTHPTSDSNYYEARLGFSSNGALYYMPVNATTWQRIAYQTALGDYLPLAGGNMTGKIYSSAARKLQWTTSDTDNNADGASWYGLGTFDVSEEGTTRPWICLSNYWGLSFRARDDNHVKINGNIILNTANYSNYALPLSGGTMTGDIKGNQIVALGTTTNPFHNIVLGGEVTSTMTAASTNPRITFQSSNNGTQQVHLIYSNFDSYRAPAGLKIIGENTSSDMASPAWLEVEGDIYAAAFRGKADTAARLAPSSITSLSSFTHNTDLIYTVQGGSNSVADKPTDVDAFGVLSLKTANGWYGQLLISSDSASGLYWRTATSLNAGWNKVLDSTNYSDYALPLNGGGQITGRITKEGVSTNWNKGRDGALIAITKLNSYSALASMKTVNGSWDIGSYSDTNYTDDLLFTYISDTHYNGSNSVDAQIRFLENGHIVAALDGTASKANLLNSSSAANTTGLQYYSGQPTIGSADGNAYEGSSSNYKLWSYPADYTAHTTVANIQTIRMYWGQTYFHDIFASPNDENLLHRSVLNSSPKGWRLILDSANYSSYAATANHNHDSVYVNISGDTMTGALNLANNTWNKIGDDAYLGDINKAGHIGIQGINGNTGIFFTTYNQTAKLTGASLSWDGTHFIFDTTVKMPTITITNTSAANHIDFSRTGGHNAPNYINVPTSSALAVSVGGAAGANIAVMVENKSVNSFNDAETSLGTSTYEWKETYSKNYVVGKKVKLEYNSTDDSLDFIFI